MSRLLHRLGGLAYRRAWAFIAAWLLILGSVLGFALTSGGQISTSLTIDDTPSQQVLDQLADELPAASGGQGTLVLTVPAGERLDTGARAEAIADAAGQIGQMPVIVDRSQAAAMAGGGEGSAPTDAQPPAEAPTDAQPPADAQPPYRPLIVDGAPVPNVLVSVDGGTALLQMQFTTAIDALPEGAVDDVVNTAEQATGDVGIDVLPSQSLEAVHPPIGGHEAIGLVVALIVLLLTLGSLRAAGLPLVTALTGVAIGVGGAFALSESITLTTATPALALMIGLAVGIDYSLFIVNRHRRLILIDGLSAPEAAARAVATAGSAVVFAGSTVVIALTGLTIIGIGFLTTMALVAAATVALAVLIALTLLPALLGLVGERICSPKARASGGRLRSEEERHFANRWVGFLVRRPWPVIVGIVTVLIVAAVPAASMSLGMPTGESNNQDSTSRQAYDATTRAFGEGFNAPLVVVAHPSAGPALTPEQLGGVGRALGETPGVSSVSLMGASPDQSLAIFSVIPEGGPDDDSTATLVRDLRQGDAAVASTYGVALGVTGLTAINIDLSDRLADALPEYIAIIIGLSLLLLLLVFRSVVIPIKATLAFLLSIAATFGITTAVFQWGWGVGLVGMDTSGPLLSFLPIMVTGILYGLAMDYQVFLVSSIGEARRSGRPARVAIVDGFDHASRVVVAAAIIMVSVFAGFIFSEDPTIKQFGFALAVGVVIDAFLVRMTLVPAVLSLLGEHAWWLPRWLDRLVPKLDLEGEGHQNVLPQTPASPELVSPRE